VLTSDFVSFVDVLTVMETNGVDRALQPAEKPVHIAQIANVIVMSVVTYITL
jgi:hypothetical protein